MNKALVEYQPEPYSVLLRPLVYGAPIVVRVKDPSVPKKARIGEPLLFITPKSVYGLEKEYLVFALEGHGCEVMHRRKLKKLYLTRLGLSMKAAKILIRELNLVFSNEEENHNES